MRFNVYRETTVSSSYTADPSRDLVIAGRQERTREFWTQRGQQVEPYVSALVIQEARRGNAEFAEKRLDAIHTMPILELTPTCLTRAQRLIDEHGIPQEEPEDALHRAIATMNGMDVLVAWNFSHLNNPCGTGSVKPAHHRNCLSHPVCHHPVCHRPVYHFNPLKQRVAPFLHPFPTPLAGCQHHPACLFIP